MAAFNRVLLSPSGADVVQALTEAVASANKRCSSGLLRLSPRDLGPVPSRLASQREGALLWKGNDDLRQRGTEALLAWWPDHLGRQHVRISAQRREPGTELWEHRFLPPGEDRPPLWLIHPDRTYLRTLPGRERELIAVCSCGASGPPDRIGWMGERCGPCHDRGEEERRAREAPAVLRGQGRPVVSLGFLEDGLVSLGRLFPTDSGVRPFLFSPNKGGALLLWDLSGGQPRSFRSATSDPYGGALAVHAGKRLVAVGSNGRISIRAGEGLKVGPAWGVNRLIEKMAFSPDGNTLAVLSPMQCVFWAPDEDNRWQRQSDVQCRAESVAWAPDGDGVAVGGHNQFVRRTEKRATQHTFPVPGAGEIESIAFAPDGRTIALGCRAGELPRTRMEPGAVIGWDVAKGAPVGPAGSHARPVQAVGFTPDGRYLVSAGLDRTVKFWDRATMALRCTLEWHVSAVLCLAFTLDGETLVTGSADGTIKLWPWKELLEA